MPAACVPTQCPVNFISFPQLWKTFLHQHQAYRTAISAMTLAAPLQKYRMHAKEQPQEEACKQGLAQVSQALGGDGLDSMLRNLGNVGFQAMLEASGMAKQFHTISGTDGLAGAKQVRSFFCNRLCSELCGLFTLLGCWTVLHTVT